MAVWIINYFFFIIYVILQVFSLWLPPAKGRSGTQGWQPSRGIKKKLKPCLLKSDKNFLKNFTFGCNSGPAAQKTLLRNKMKNMQNIEFVG